MSLNNILLPSQLLADLYQESLVGGTTVSATAAPVSNPAPTPVTTPAPASPIPFLGKNGKNILLVVNQPDVPFLPDAELAFLTKILTACQLSLLDVAIVNRAKAPHHDEAAVLAQFAARSVILFGLSPLPFGLPPSSPMYAVQNNGSVQFVAAPALQQIEKTKEAKNQLWIALKQLFGL